MLTPIVTAGLAAETADRCQDESHRLLYGEGSGPGYPDNVLEHLEIVLSTGGWVALLESEVEGDIEELLLRQGQYCVTASYDPVTRQVNLNDGKNELEMALDMLADDGVLPDGKIDFAAASEHWNVELLTAADDLLHGRIAELPQLASPVQITVVGLHPRADGTLRGPHSAELAQHQLRALGKTVDLISEEFIAD